MADPYVGEIRAFGFNFAPMDWAFCDGQTIPAAQQQALYAVIGTLYGGSVPNQTFVLPDLRGQIPIDAGSQNGLTVAVAQKLGAESVTLTSAQMAAHSHTFNMASGTFTQMGGGATPTPPSTSSLPSRPIIKVAQTGIQFANYNAYGSNPPNATMAPGMLSHAYGNASGGADPHDNHMPYQVVNFCICLNGNFPSRP